MVIKDLDDASLLRTHAELLRKHAAYLSLLEGQNRPADWSLFKRHLLAFGAQPPLPTPTPSHTDDDELTTWRNGVGRNLQMRRLAEINFHRAHDDALHSILVRSLTAAYDRTKIVLLNTCFHISVVDNFGVINGCRVGRRPTVWVSADEINSGLGYMAILIATIKRKVVSHINNYKQPAGARHTILVRGRQSAVLVDDDEQSEYPLHIVDGLFVPYFHIPKFNTGLIALLEIFKDVLRATKQHLYSQLTTEPFPISSAGTVKGLSIKYASEETAQWTESMKLFLIDIKWFLGELARWQSSHFSNINDQ